MKKIVTLLSVLLLVFAFSGCSSKEAKNYDTFTYENMTIKVPKDLNMEEADYEEFAYTLEGANWPFSSEVLQKRIWLPMV